jgi:hypothetical protein
MSDLVPLKIPEIRKLLWQLLQEKGTRAEVLAWSHWRRRHQRRAQMCNYKRRAARHAP